MTVSNAAVHVAPCVGFYGSNVPLIRDATMPMAMTTASNDPKRIRRSMMAAETRDPSPAIVYERTTSSGVSTSTV